jgi:threonine dehydrogenase-like Zn-dependent dehydrogenase
LTRDVPVKADEIEALMQEARRAAGARCKLKPLMNDASTGRRACRRQDAAGADSHFDFDVTIVGAGPVGLALAGWLARNAARPGAVDRADRRTQAWKTASAIRVRSPFRKAAG